MSTFRQDHVYVQVYDLSQGMARQMSLPLIGKQIDGIWHSGIVFRGYEYYYGAGISRDPAGMTPYGRPQRTVDLGRTNKSQDEWAEFLEQVRPRFTQERYHLLDHNCNTFSQEAAMFLTGKGIPEDVRDLPSEAMNSPIGAMLRPLIDGIMQQAHGVDWNHIHDDTGPAPSGRAAPGRRSSSGSRRVKPQHRHVPIGLKHVKGTVGLSGYEPVLFRHGDVVKIFAALRGFLPDSFKKQYGETIDSLEAFLVVQTMEQEKGNPDAPHPKDAFRLLDALLSVLPAAKVFPAVDILRLCLLQRDAAVHYSSKKPLTAVLRKFGAPRELPLPLRIMTVRALCNMFATEPGRAYMLSSGVQEAMVDLAADAMTSKEARVRMGAATLAYNYAPLLPKDDSTGPIGMLSALTHALTIEDDAETAYRTLMAVGSLLFCSDAGVELMAALEPDLKRFQKPLAGKPWPSKVSEVAADVDKLITTT